MFEELQYAIQRKEYKILMKEDLTEWMMTARPSGFSGYAWVAYFPRFDLYVQRQIEGFTKSDYPKLS